MTFAFAGIGAVAATRVEDYFPKGKRSWLRLHEKGGKRHETPRLWPRRRSTASATMAPRLNP